MTSFRVYFPVSEQQRSSCQTQNSHHAIGVRPSIKPITALHSTEVNVSMCSTSSPEPQHMSGFVGNRIKPHVLIVARHFLCENVHSTATSLCDLYIWSNFIHKDTS